MIGVNFIALHTSGMGMVTCRARKAGLVIQWQLGDVIANQIISWAFIIIIYTCISTLKQVLETQLHIMCTLY